MKDFSIRQLKTDAKYEMRHGYLKMVIICILISFFVEGFFTSSLDSGVRFNNISFNIGSNSEVVHKLVSNIKKVDIVDEERLIEGKTGVFAVIIDNVTRAGSFIFGIVNAVNEWIFGDKLMVNIVLCVGVALSFLYWLFICTNLNVGRCRFFMERRKYIDTPIQRILFTYRIGKMRHISLVMFLRFLYILLWSFTIAGGVIKFYSYRMIPYIMAENPGLKSDDAFKLSEEMMRGNKWRLFLTDMSFIGWQALSLLSLGIVAYIYVNPYMEATFTEFYMALRERSIADKKEFAELFADRYLDSSVEVRSLYPEEYGLYFNRPRRNWPFEKYAITYDVKTLIFVFLIFSFCGWLWEVIYHMVNYGELVNRGMLYGPWLPIYGSGGVAVIIVLRRFRDKPALTFLITMLLCGIIEYVTAWYMEMIYRASWWNYDDVLFNIKGRVCLEGLLLFGAGSCLANYVLYPVLSKLIKKIPKKLSTAICIIVTICFIFDVIVSFISPNMGEGITNPR